jgi:hypothetical protein
MAEPVYMLCCQSGADDRNSGIASHFNIIDKFEVQYIDISKLNGDVPTVVFAQPLRVVAVWRAVEDADYEGQFEVEFKAASPGQPEWSFFASTFRFDRSKPRHRFTIDLPPPLFQESGCLVIESRIRRDDNTDWLYQKYIIDIVVDRKEPEGAAEPHADDSAANHSPHHDSSGSQAAP